MNDTITLFGYHYSVYTRIARLVLMHKHVSFEIEEVDPFGPLPEGYDKLHPFGRVPALRHGRFELFETGAITRYVDRVFDGPSLQPSAPADLARMDQVIGLVDSYAYVPMVRQVFSHAVFRPLMGEQAQQGEVEAGLAASRRVLGALDWIAEEGMVLSGDALTLADCHLAPMIDYFQRATEGAVVLSEFASLSRWWCKIREGEAFKLSDPLKEGHAQK
jgi:glutathione S-transferase